MQERARLKRAKVAWRSVNARLRHGPNQNAPRLYERQGSKFNSRCRLRREAAISVDAPGAEPTETAAAVRKKKKHSAPPQRNKGSEAAAAAAADLRHQRAITRSHLDEDRNSQRCHSHSPARSLSAFYLHLLPTLQRNHVTNHIRMYTNTGFHQQNELYKTQSSARHSSGQPPPPPSLLRQTQQRTIRF